MLDWLTNTQILGFQAVEFFAVIFILLNVLLMTFAKNKKLAWWNWPTGIVGTLLYTFVFWQWQLFANAFLQIYYVITGFWGMVAWNKKDAEAGDNDLNVLTLSPQARAIAIAATVFGTLIFYWFFDNYTENPAPFWDSFIASLSFVSQYLLIKRYLENWIGWIIVDLVAIPVFWINGLRPTAILYVILLILAISGLRQWLQTYNDNKKSFIDLFGTGGFTERKEVTKVGPAIFD